MKTRETTPGKTYSVHTMKGCTIIEPDGWQKTIEAPDGYFDAHFGSVVIEGDDEASIKQLFKLAPYQKLRLLGVVGGNADGLPAGYKRVEYLESTGTQYIISNVIPGEEIEIELEYFMSSEISAYSAVLGLAENQTKGTWRINVAGSKPHCGGLMAEYGWWQDYRLNPIPSFDSKNKLYFWSRVNEAATSIYKLNEEVIPLRGTGVTYPKNELERASYPLALFARKREGNAVNVDSNCPCKIYSLKIKTNGQNYHFIPCLDETGAPCMYDKVSRKAFYNAGSGDFLYPTESTTYSLRRVLPDWGKLTERGLRRLYHAPESYNGDIADYALENGYKPIVEESAPDEGYWSPHWTETDDEIVLEWVKTEPPMEEPLTETE